MSEKRKQRYTLAIDFYIHADDDADAINQAMEVIRKMRAEEDNQAKVLSLHRTPFGSLTSTKIDV